MARRKEDEGCGCLALLAIWLAIQVLNLVFLALRALTGWLQTLDWAMVAVGTFGVVSVLGLLWLFSLPLQDWWRRRKLTSGSAPRPAPLAGTARMDPLEDVELEPPGPRAGRVSPVAAARQVNAALRRQATRRLETAGPAFVARAAGVQRLTCPFCQSPIAGTEQRVDCPVCGIPHHADCWQENGGCSTYGCEAGPRSY